MSDILSLENLGWAQWNIEMGQKWTHVYLYFLFLITVLNLPLLKNEQMSYSLFGKIIFPHTSVKESIQFIKIHFMQCFLHFPGDNVTGTLNRKMNISFASTYSFMRSLCMFRRLSKSHLNVTIFQYLYKL